MERFWTKIFKSFLPQYDICIDLGTANTVVAVKGIKGKSIVINEPSVVALTTGPDGKKKILAVGEEAKKMVGRTPANISALYPMKDGVIADYDVAEAMIKTFIQKVQQPYFFLNKIFICVPYGATRVDRRAIHDSALSTGAREVVLVEEPLAAAIGAGLQISLPQAHMIVDIGGGTTEIGVISLGSIAAAKSVNIGGYKIDEAIKNHISAKFGVKIGDSTAEAIKKDIGSVWGDDSKQMIVRGFDLQKGGPKEIIVKSSDVKESLIPLLNLMGDSIKSMFEAREISYDLCGDIARDGIILSGGGALLEGIDSYLSDYTGLSFTIAKDPLLCVIKGLEQML